jgi:segregation and condensation protein A
MRPDESSSHITVSLPRYSGPLDVIIAMIRRNEWSIDDLPVLEITRQFLAHIRASNDVDSELGGEFVETASWLVLLKSRSLLPSDGDKTTLPQQELRRAVLDHVSLQAATELLRGRYDRDARPASEGAPVGRRDTVLPRSADDLPTVDDVLAAAREALASARAAASFTSSDQDSATVEQKIRWISAQLAEVPFRTALSTGGWFEEQPSPEARVALFLALLELARKGFLLLHQPREDAAILIQALCAVPEAIQFEEPFALQA